MTSAVGGLRKPLNQLINPTSPDIRKQPLRFVWSRKYWKVSPGDVTLGIEPDTQHTLGNAVRVVSKDSSRIRYGVSSHRDYVNKAFRPPLETMLDYLPLNRQPRGLVQPRAANPGSAHESGGYRAQNFNLNNVDGYLTDRVKEGELNAGAYCPVLAPIEDNSVLPDLETTIPYVSAGAGYNPQLKIDGTENTIETFEDVIPRVGGTAGFHTKHTIDGAKPYEDLTLDEINPRVSGKSGFVSQFTNNGPSGYEEIHLQDKGMRTETFVLNPAPRGVDTIDYTHQDTSTYLQNPIKYSATASKEYGFRSSSHLDSSAPKVQGRRYNLPNWGVDSAGAMVGVNQFHDRRVKLKQK